ncbi:MAG: histidine phosphatase family protein [Candidatus Nanohaloarchaea archaeon]|nr:histidine phosphatase family protein [Candidatus Nanohaloarchaea archaeon]
MTRILLARHGETDHNRDEILQGHTDVDLNEAGREQARRLAEHLAEEDVAAVYTSDLARARKTAEIVGVEHGLEPESLQALRERTYGELEGEPRDTRRDHIDHPDELDELKPDGGEDVDDVRGRVRPVINDIRREHGGDTVVLVGHGWVNRAILTAALGADSGRAHAIRQSNACVNELEYEDYRGWRINRVNDTSHLDAE